jgi:hypothetical protein
MEQRELDELLKQLHARLGSTRSVDAEDRELLGTVLRDIESLLGRNDAVAPHATRLDALAAKFDAEHPALADALRQLVDALGKAGI